MGMKIANSETHTFRLALGNCRERDDDVFDPLLQHVAELGIRFLLDAGKLVPRTRLALSLPSGSRCQLLGDGDELIRCLADAARHHVFQATAGTNQKRRQLAAKNCWLCIRLDLRDGGFQRARESHDVALR